MVVIDRHEQHITGSKNIRQTSQAVSDVNLVENLGDARARPEGPNFGSKPRGP